MSRKIQNSYDYDKPRTFQFDFGVKETQEDKEGKVISTSFKIKRSETVCFKNPDEFGLFFRRNPQYASVEFVKVTRIS